MAVEGPEERAAFFDPEVFGVAATWSPAGGGGPITVNGIFDNEFASGLQEDDVAVETSQPRFTCASEDVPNIAQGDSLTVNATIYAVVGVQPDGTGITELLLEPS
ncbi:head-tail joining protein [Pelagibius sp.]|uniref:head-tail joining protein n=1 Tax=Pelagibius sp. TaxID=1931238 RepID=UPI00260F98D3|nr:head-tail joining protein [Pelagibius sp.]